MKTAVKTISFFVILLSLLFFACSNSTEETGPESVNGETTLSIVLPGGSSDVGKAVGDPGLLQYEISGTGPNGESFTETGLGGTTITVTIVPGMWHIKIRAFDPADPAKTDEADSEYYDVDVQTGQNNTLPIQMRFVQIAPIVNYLNAVGGTLTEPASLHLAIPLDSSAWNDLLTALNTAGKYVDLDLSACTRSSSAGTAGLDSNGAFDPDSSVATGKDKIVSLVLPDAANSIADGTFSNPTFNHFSELETVGGMNVDNIGDWAFYYCASLVSVDFPSLTNIGERGFSNCASLISVDFPNVTNISIGAFEYCTSLVSAEFPQVANIDTFVFFSCTNLVSMESDNITNIDFGAFWHCTSLVSVDFPNVTSIGYTAFQDCSSLVSITFPQVTSIGDGAFASCTSLTSVEFPASATIFSSSFLGCTMLTQFTLTGTSSSLSVIEGGKALVLNNDELIAYPTASGSLTMSSITKISDYAFVGCTNLTSVDFPLVTSIGDDAFNGCTSLTTLTSTEFPLVTSIGDYAFSFCENLVSVEFPLVESIGESAFSFCENLISVEFPQVMVIGDYAFALCTNLDNIEFPNLISIGSSVFGGFITSVIIGAGLTDFTDIHDGFDSYYSMGGMLAGTYLFNAGSWTGPF